MSGNAAPPSTSPALRERSPRGSAAGEGAAYVADSSQRALARTNALLQLAQAHGAAPQRHGPALWVPYGGSEAIVLAIVLLVVASGFAYAGKRLRTPLEVKRPGSTTAGFMIAIWLLAIYTSGVATFVYGLQLKQAYPGFVAPRVRVGTFVDAAVTFFVILYLTRRWGWKVALAGAIIGTAAAPMIFEFPFDAGDRVRLLRGRRDVCGIRRLGCIRVCLSYGTVAACAERHFEDPLLRSSDHAICLAGGRGSLCS